MKKICTIVLGLAVILTVAGYIPIWQADAEAKRNRDRVCKLIKIGDNLYEAQESLKQAGFELYHEKPIKPTIAEDYFQQLIIVGDTDYNFFEVHAYILGLDWAPFVRHELPYVVVDAKLTGEITRIE